MPVLQMNHWSSAQRNHMVQSGFKPRTFNSKSSILSDTFPVCPVRLRYYTRWKPDGSLLYGRRCQVLPPCFEFLQFGENLWWVYFHKSTFSHQTSAEPSTPLPSKKPKKFLFFLLFMVNSKQTVTAATTGANSGQTPSPW